IILSPGLKPVVNICRSYGIFLSKPYTFHHSPFTIHRSLFNIHLRGIFFLKILLITLLMIKLT
ncbi:MAG TPA: hypothetical protein PKV07_02850, partial [Candidatus Cloacimonas acidaminovorans]|nr:hypothetical protein [Candidatus Cloacimonas acidaminovorans]